LPRHASLFCTAPHKAIEAAGAGLAHWNNLYLACAFFVAAVLIALSLKMANAWEKFVVLRMGKLQGARGAGLFVIIPILDRIVAIIDSRIQTTAFNAEQARVILGSAETAIAGQFVEAAAQYSGHPIALQLRAMNIIYETTKERGATILMPSSMVDSLNPTVTSTLALALAGKEAIGSGPAREPAAP
jgi:hypothetical protein